MSDAPMPAWAAAMEARLANGTRDLGTDLRAEIASLRAGVMERIDRLQTRVDDHAQRLEGAITLANAADSTAGGADVASLERDLVRARAQAAHGQLIGTLMLQVAKLEDQVRELREGRAA